MLAPNRWALRVHQFISGRPVYAPVRTGNGTGPAISLPLEDDAADKLDLVLGQTHRLLGENGDALAQRLVLAATLTLRRDGGIPGDNWMSDTYEAVLTVDAPPQDGLTFGSQAELVVYQLLVDLQRERSPQHAIAVMPLPGAKLRDAGVRTPDFVVLGNGRAVVIEVDGPHHYGRTRKADDADRDLHWSRCWIPTIRIVSQHTDDHQVHYALIPSIGARTARSCHHACVLGHNLARIAAGDVVVSHAGCPP